MKSLELTFAILKPHIIKNPVALKSIRNIILTSNFKIVRSKRHTLTVEDASKFYQEHKSKFFYDRLVTFMTSGPSDLYILARQNAIQEWRNLMGPTKVYKTVFENPTSIRGMFGLSDTRNGTHGSDSPKSVAKEISIFYPEFSIEDWYTNQEPIFRENRLKFIDENFIHNIDSTHKIETVIVN